MVTYQPKPPPQWWLHNSFFPAHQSQTKYFRQTFRQIYLWPHQLQKRMTKTVTFNLLHEKRERSTDATATSNLKTVRANFLTKLHRTWVWWTRTKKKKLYQFSVQNLETIVWKKEEEEKEKKEKRKKKMEKWICLAWTDESCSECCILQNRVQYFVWD